jgi:hypothetical protein
VAESLAIVVSILLAFGIQAWWEGVGEDRTRDALLEGLRSDFDLAAAQLDTVMAVVDMVAEASERWLVLSRAGEVSPELVAVADTLLTEMLYNSPYQPPLGTVDAVVSNGGMSVLDDPSLTRDLRTWAALLASYRTRESAAFKFQQEQLLPFLFFEAGLAVADLTWTERMAPGYPLGPRHTDGYLLLTDRRFQGMVSDIWYQRADIREQERSLRPVLERIRGRLAER